MANRESYLIPPSYIVESINDNSGAIFDVIPALAGYKGVLWGLILSESAVVTIQVYSAATALTGPMSIAALQIDTPVGRVMVDSALPVFASASGEALRFEPSGAARLAGQKVYTYVKA
jgi:hypothetical protein